jgi:hypothetical protein
LPANNPSRLSIVDSSMIELDIYEGFATFRVSTIGRTVEIPESRIERNVDL